MNLPEHIRRLWAGMDEMFAVVEPTPWGAVVTDARYPRIWDANYARVERPASLADVASALEPALRAAGAEVFHVVVFDPVGSTSLLTELSSRGHRLGWDMVLQARSGSADAPRHEVEILPDGPELWDAVTTSLDVFGIEPDEAVAQLRAIETDVMLPGGKRWYAIRDAGRVVSIAALLTIDGVGYIDNVATVPQARGRGFASDLVRAIVRDAAAGSQRTVLLADPDEPRIVEMYRRLGFSEAGRLASTKGPIPQLTNL